MPAKLSPQELLNNKWVEVSTSDLVDSSRTDYHFNKLLHSKEVGIIHSTYVFKIVSLFLFEAVLFWLLRTC